MKLTTFTKPGSIFLKFDQPTVSIYRKAEGETDYTFIGTSYSGDFDDDDVEFGTAYMYRLVSDSETVYSDFVWCFADSVLYGGVTSSYDKRTLMARLLNLSTGSFINPDDVVDVSVAVFRYLESDITTPQTTYLYHEIKQREEIITANPILTGDWTADETGYNFRYKLRERYPYPVKVEALVSVKSGTDFMLSWILK